VLADVVGGRFARHLWIAPDAQDVVRDLEGQAQVLAEATVVGQEFGVIADDERVQVATATKRASRLPSIKMRYSLIIAARRVSRLGSRDCLWYRSQANLAEDLAGRQRLGSALQAGEHLPKKQNAGRIRYCTSLKKETTFGGDMGNEIRLIVFDFDGVLIDGRQIVELAKRAGVQEEVEMLIKQWEESSSSPSPYHQKAVSLLRGLAYSDAIDVAGNLPIMPGAKEVVRILKDRGLKMAVITNGYYVTTGVLVEELGIDYVFANELSFDNSVASGMMKEHVGDAAAKAQALERVARLEGITLDQCIAVGDGVNDLLMMKKAGLGIAFNGDHRLRQVAEVVEGKDLRRILPYVLARVDENG
jgi:phosphoserine phosphatase SerB